MAGERYGCPGSLTRVYLIRLSQPYVQSDLLLQAFVCRSPPQQARSVRQVWVRAEGRLSPPCHHTKASHIVHLISSLHRQT